MDELKDIAIENYFKLLDSISVGVYIKIDNLLDLVRFINLTEDFECTPDTIINYYKTKLIC